MSAGNDLDFLADLIARAQAAGAGEADAVMLSNASLSVNWRLGRLEDVERAESSDLGLRVLVGKRQAVASSTDRGAAALDELVERAVAMARAAPEDKYCGLAEAGRLEGAPPDLDLHDGAEPDAAALMELAAAAEDAARAVEGVTNSDGGSAGWSKSTIALAASNGFAGGYAVSSFGLSSSVIAGTGTAMETDYEFHQARHQADLDGAAALGRAAGERAVRRLGPRKLDTDQMPIVFEPRVGKSLIGHLAGAINGNAVARGSSFLRDKMGETLFPAGVNIIDDARLARGIRSKPFDGEGVVTGRLAVVEDGKLSSWLLDSASARQLDLATTGHAGRGTSSPPSPGATNLYLEAGPSSRDDMLGAIKSGLYVTDLMGFGVNGVTGDYSQGAAGFRIEDGALTYPVSEITIAGNLLDMFARLTPADDLEFRYGVNVPTLRIDGMTVAGN